MSRTQRQQRQNPESAPQGPRPLPLHLVTLLNVLTSSRLALPMLNSGLLPWKPELRDAASELVRDLANVDPEAFVAALDAEAQHRIQGFLAGVTAYRCHARRQEMPPVPCVWQDGTTRLLDYGDTQAASAAQPERPVLVIPSLINRAYVLDIAPKRSLMRWLASQGFRPFLVDWDAPGEAERAFTLSDYIAGRLEGALDALQQHCGARPVAVIGYCMGGLLALALAHRQRQRIAALALLATPWDFHTGGAHQVALHRLLAGQARAIIETFGALPVDVLQALFSALDPYAVHRKFQSFATQASGSSRRAEFVALEDWLNDGVPLVSGVARECLEGWYGDNTPARGCWQVAGTAICPEQVSQPTLLMVPERDYIVPPASALALAEALPSCQVRMARAGHIGMVAGSRCQGVLYEPLAEWLCQAIGDWY